MKEYLISLDLSMSNSGICVFDLENSNPVEIFSIPTNAKSSHGERLKTIYDGLMNIKNKYNIKIVVLEQGFTRFNLSTQCVFKVHGIANFVFYDIEQIYYAPSSVKKTISGSGKTDKNGIKEIIVKKYPNIIINNDDESDAVSIGMCWFINNKKGEK